MELKNKKVVFLGDSITEGIGVSTPEKSYVNQFQAKNQPITVKNYGISGSRIAKQHHPDPGSPPHERYFSTRVAEMDADADIVVVFGGVNDYGHGDAPFGRIEDRTVDTFCGACHVLMRSLIERYPTATIVFMTPLNTLVAPKNKVGSPSPLIDYVSAIRQIAESYSIPVLDLYATSGMNANISAQKEKMMPDGIHPNDLGTERIADRLTGFLRSL